MCALLLCILHLLRVLIEIDMIDSAIRRQTEDRVLNYDRMLYLRIYSKEAECNHLGTPGKNNVGSSYEHQINLTNKISANDSHLAVRASLFDLILPQRPKPLGGGHNKLSTLLTGRTLYVRMTLEKLPLANANLLRILHYVLCVDSLYCWIC